MKTIEGICGVCPGGCAVEIDLEDGKIQDLRPSEKFPFSALCIRGMKAKDIVYSSDRVLRPKIRVGEKGEGKFRDASWEEALDLIEKGFKDAIEKYGPKGIASHFGRGSFDQSTSEFFGTANPLNGKSGFFSPIGSPNDGSVGSLCYLAFGLFAPMTTMGLKGANMAPDVENADRVVIWGSNPPTGSPPFMYKRLKAAQKRGCKLICVDHYESIMAKNSDDVILVKSGTDGALLLGMMRYIIKHKKYDQEFVENYVEGFEEFVDYIEEFTLEKTSHITKVDKEDILRLIEYFTSEKTALLTYTGLEYSNCGVQSIRAIYTLCALCGHLDKKGGLLLTKPNLKNPPFAISVDKDKIDGKGIGAEEFPLFWELANACQFTKFPQAVLEAKPYKIAALLNVGSSITINYPNSKLYEEALKALDFYVVVDRFMTKDTLFADVVLPATTYFEEEGYQVYPKGIRKKNRIIEPVGESKANIYILQMIAERLGYGDLLPKNEKELLKFRFSHMDGVLEKLEAGEEFIEFPKKEISYEKYKTGGLREDGQKGFPTKSGKFEIKSSILEDHGYEPLPKFVLASEGEENAPEVFKNFPLILNTGARIQTSFRSQHLNIDSLLSIQKDPLVIMNSEDAKERGIKDGDMVKLSSPRGEIIVVANVIDGIHKGEVEVNVGGGAPFHKGLWREANTNYLTDDKNFDPISGFPVFKQLLCQLEKVD